MELSTSPLTHYPRGLEKEHLSAHRDKLILSSLKSQLKTHFEGQNIEKIYHVAKQQWTVGQAEHLYYLPKGYANQLPKPIFIHEASKTIFLSLKNQKVGDGNQNVVKKAVMIRIGETVEDTTTIIVAKVARQLGFLNDEKDENPQWETHLQHNMTAALNEIRVLNDLKGSPHIIQLLGAAIYNGRKQKQEVEKLVLFVPLFQTDLFRARRENALHHFPKSEWILAAHKICVSLAAVHEKNIIHQDLKLENVLILPHGNGNEVVLTDFGHAIHRTHTQQVKKIGGTVAIWAPETFERFFSTRQMHVDSFQPSLDCWGLGMFLYNLFYGEAPWEETAEELMDCYNSFQRMHASLEKEDPLYDEKLELIAHNKEQMQLLYDEYHAKVKEFEEKDTSSNQTLFYIIQRLLRWNAKERISAKQAGDLFQPVVNVLLENDEP